MTARQVRIPQAEGLGRTVLHDERSKLHPAPVAPIRSVHFDRHIPILNQLRTGKCTCEAAAGALGTVPFWATVPKDVKAILGKPGDQPGHADGWTDGLYHDETLLEDPSDPWPPNDQGGSGLEVSKVLKTRKLIAGYRHAFGLTHALAALSVAPGLLGLPWYRSMFDAKADGTITVDLTSPLDGGHELLCRELDVKVTKTAVTGWVWVDNSWSGTWGSHGRGRISVADFGALLAHQGDVVIPTPVPAA